MEKENRYGAISSVVGVILLFIGTLLHPMQADPNVPITAFAEYARDHHWVTTHLMQLAGVVGIVIGLILFARTMGNSGLVDVARFSAVASAVLAAALQAVDGVALKAMVNAWTAAAEVNRQNLFHAAVAVRMIEIGLASMFCLAIGFTALLYSIALYKNQRYPVWLAYLGGLGGIATAVAGVVIAYTGFSELAMMINMPANLALLVWMLAFAMYQWRKAEMRWP